MSDEYKHAAENTKEAGGSLVSSKEAHAARPLSVCGF